MRGTSPAARGRQRYVLARTRFVGFARRGPHVHARARRPGQIYSVPIRIGRGARAWRPHTSQSAQILTPWR